MKIKFLISSIAAGILPHTFCILFILFSIFGATTASVLFKPLLLNSNFFYFLIILSLGFATFSAILYLAKNGILSLKGAKRKWRYLSLMYGLTILINLCLFLFIFPATANFNRRQSYVLGNQTKEIVLQVDIPCSGHAPLVTDELKKINGIEKVKFSLPNIFRISYDSTKTNEKEILSQDIFESFRVKISE